MPLISIVTSYFNRKKELLNTLQVLKQSEIKDFELIIVDDGSSEDNRLEYLLEDFNFVKLFRIDTEDKSHINPCIPFNLGISKAKGEIIVLQSPECIHVGDVLKFIVENTVLNQYLVFSCYSLDKASTDLLGQVPLSEEVILRSINLRKGSCDELGRYNSWFIHPHFRPRIYNFLVSLTREDMLSLGGFDERFANGYAFDDTEFAGRVVKKGMDIDIVDYPFCLHQYHEQVAFNIQDLRTKETANRLLFEELSKSSNYKAYNSFLT